MLLVLKARISSFHYTRILSKNQEELGAIPGQIGKRIFCGDLKLKNFEISETLGANFLNSEILEA